jgi:hypothetical protein
MKQLIRPLVYILGFSVFCACTTIKTVSQNDLRHSDDERNLIVILVDGARLELRAATLDSENVQGLIAQEDSLAFSRYVVSARSGDPIIDVPVVIPRSDVVEANVESPSSALSMAMGFVTVVVFVGFLFFKRGDCSGLC